MWIKFILRVVLLIQPLSPFRDRASVIQDVNRFTIAKYNIPPETLEAAFGIGMFFASGQEICRIIPNLQPHNISVTPHF
jgi:hypothetical protein